MNTITSTIFRLLFTKMVYLQMGLSVIEADFVYKYIFGEKIGKLKEYEFVSPRIRYKRHNNITEIVIATNDSYSKMAHFFRFSEDEKGLLIMNGDKNYYRQSRRLKKAWKTCLGGSYETFTIQSK